MPPALCHIQFESDAGLPGFVVQQDPIGQLNVGRAGKHDRRWPELRDVPSIVLIPANVFSVPPVAERELPVTDSTNMLAPGGTVLPSNVIPPNATAGPRLSTQKYFLPSRPENDTVNRNTRIPHVFQIVVEFFECPGGDVGDKHGMAAHRVHEPDELLEKIERSFLIGSVICPVFRLSQFCRTNVETARTLGMVDASSRKQECIQLQFAKRRKVFRFLHEIEDEHFPPPFSGLFWLGLALTYSSFRMSLT